VPRVQPGARRSAVRPQAVSAGAATLEGCAFAPRCPWAAQRCRSDRPLLRELSQGTPGVHAAACHVAETVAASRSGDS
jgi:ABC-type dipeptide/oligopeptide/nickel transport system ATPase component